MDPQLLLNRTTPKLTPKITKINSLVEVSTKARKSSTKLRKVFEKGTYQKKTQLSVLNRYKRRLDSIQKQNDKRFAKKQRVKLKLPQIKKYVGSFFTGGSDPLKSLAQLAAFNALQKGAKGDILGALGPALVFGGLTLGPSLLKGGLNLARGGAASATAAGGGVPNLPPAWWQKNPKSLGRANESYARYIAGEANIGDRARLGRRGLISASGMFSRGGTEALERQAGKPLAKQALGRFGKAILPGAGAAFSFQSAKERDKSGDKFGSAIDNIAGSLDAFAAGVQIAAAASAASGIGIPGAAIIELAAGVASIGSFGLDMFNLFRDLTGQSDKEAQKNKLKAQTEKQKAVEEKAQGEKLTFQKTLNRYEKVVNKFEEFAKNFKTTREILETTEGGSATPPPPPTNPYTGPVDKDTFFPLPGGVLSTREVGYPGGEYGAERAYEGGHSGQDIGGLEPGSPVVAWKTGTISYSGSVEAGDTILTIDHGEGLQSVYKHVVPTVADGSTVYGGQQIASLFNARKYAPHLHFEVWKGGSHKNPNQELSASQRISSPMDVSRAEQEFKKRTQNKPQSTSPISQKPQSLQGLSIGAGGFNINNRPVQAQRIAPTPSAPAPAPAPVQAPSPAPRYIESPTQPQDIVIRYPVIRQVVSTPAQSSQPMISSGPSQQELLNSFYKRVLLNTVA